METISYKLKNKTEKIFQLQSSPWFHSYKWIKHKNPDLIFVYSLVSKLKSTSVIDWISVFPVLAAFCLTVDPPTSEKTGIYEKCLLQPVLPESTYTCTLHMITVCCCFPNCIYPAIHSFTGPAIRQLFRTSSSPGTVLDWVAVQWAQEAWSLTSWSYSLKWGQPMSKELQIAPSEKMEQGEISADGGNAGLYRRVEGGLLWGGDIYNDCVSVLGLL